MRRRGSTFYYHLLLVLLFFVVVASTTEVDIENHQHPPTNLRKGPEVVIEVNPGEGPSLTLFDTNTLEASISKSRRERVKKAMKKCWHAYRTYAWGMDELRPVSLTGHNNWGNVGATIVDSLDTLWIMGLKEEFMEGRDWVRDHLTFEPPNPQLVSVFEINIRVLGGLLSAYDLSGDGVFLSKAKELGDRLLPAFNTPTGLPWGFINLKTGELSDMDRPYGVSILSELGSLQMELRALSQRTGDPRYEQAAMRVYEYLQDKVPSDSGLYPLRMRREDGGSVDDKVAMGGMGDSFYEYLLKVWLLGGKVESRWRQMFDEAMEGMTRKLLVQSKGPDKLLYITHSSRNRPGDYMEELTCFLPGTLALGAVTSPYGMRSPQATRYMDLATDLARTCHEMAIRQPTRLPPEATYFNRQNGDMTIKTGTYLQRPETVESFYYLWKFTDEAKYKEWSWDFFESLDRFSSTPEAYGVVTDVTLPHKMVEDSLQTFFLAETLKYIYLTQATSKTPTTSSSGDSTSSSSMGLDIDLQEYVFNTEAHPFKMPITTTTTTTTSSTKTTSTTTTTTSKTWRPR